MIIVAIFITAIITILATYQKYNENVIRDKGNWEAEFVCVKYSDTQEIAKDKNIKEISIYYDYGMSDENLDKTNTSFERIHLYGYDENKLKNSGIHLKRGRMPQNSNEIVISGQGNRNRIELGETVNLTFEGNTKAYTVVGLADDYIKGDNGDASFSDGKDNRFGAITLLDTNTLQEEQIINASVILNNPKKIYEVTEKLVEKLQLESIENISKETGVNKNELVGKDLPEWYKETINNMKESSGINESIYEEYVNAEELPEGKVIYNEELLEWLGAKESLNESYNLFTMIELIIVVFIGIVGIAVLVISFAITYRERIKELEMLTSLGMSKSQRRKMCIKEGTIIWIIGVTIGIILGIILSEFVIRILAIIISNAGETLFFNESEVAFEMYLPTKIIAIIAAIMYVIVIISALLPLRKMKKIDIITGVRGINKKKRKTIKVPFIIRKTFKQEGELAYKYTKREKARHTSMVSSIAVSVALFLIVNGIIINFLQYNSKLTYDDYLIEGESPEKVEQIIDYLEQNGLINGYLAQTEAFQLTINQDSTRSSIFDLYINIPIDKLSDEMLEILGKDRSFIMTSTTYGEGENSNPENTQRFIFLPYYYNDEAYNEILKRAGISELKENECILLNTQQIENSAYGESFEITKYEVRR